MTDGLTSDEMFNFLKVFKKVKLIFVLFPQTKLILYFNVYNLQTQTPVFVLSCQYEPADGLL